MFLREGKIISASSCLHVTTLDLDWRRIERASNWVVCFPYYFLLVSLIWELRKPNSFFLFNFFCTKTSLPSETHFATILPQQRWRHENIWRPKKKEIMNLRKYDLLVPESCSRSLFSRHVLLNPCGKSLDGRKKGNLFRGAGLGVFFLAGGGSGRILSVSSSFFFSFFGQVFLGIKRRRIGSYCSLMMMYLVIIWFWSSSYSALPMFSSPEDLIQIRSWTGSFPLAES